MDRWWRSPDWRSFADGIDDPSSARLALTAAANGLSIYNRDGGRYQLAAVAEDPAVVMAFHAAGDDASYPEHAADALATYDDITAALQSAGVPEPVAAGRAALVFGATSVPHDYIAVAKHLPVNDSALRNAADQALAEEFSALVRSDVGKADTPWDESEVNRDELGRFSREGSGVQTRKVMIDGVAYAVKEQAKIGEGRKAEQQPARQRELSDEDILARASEQAEQAERAAAQEKRAKRLKRAERRRNRLQSVGAVNEQNAKIEQEAAKRRALEQEALRASSRTGSVSSERKARIERLSIASGSNDQARRKRTVGGKANASAAGAGGIDEYVEEHFFSNTVWTPDYEHGSLKTVPRVPAFFNTIGIGDAFAYDKARADGVTPLPRELVSPPVDVASQSYSVIIDETATGRDATHRMDAQQRDDRSEQEFVLEDVYDATPVVWSLVNHWNSASRSLQENSQATGYVPRAQKASRLLMESADAGLKLVEDSSDIRRDDWVKVNTVSGMYGTSHEQDGREDSSTWMLVRLSDLFEDLAGDTKGFSEPIHTIEAKRGLVLDKEPSGDAQWIPVKDTSKDYFGLSQPLIPGVDSVTLNKSWDESEVVRDSSGRFAEETSAGSAVSRAEAEAEAERKRKVAARNTRRRRRLAAVNTANDIGARNNALAAARNASSSNTVQQRPSERRSEQRSEVRRVSIASGSTQSADLQHRNFRAFVLRTFGPDGFKERRNAVLARKLIEEYPQSQLMDYGPGELVDIYTATSKNAKQAAQDLQSLSRDIRQGRKDKTSKMYGMSLTWNVSMALSALNGLAMDKQEDLVEESLGEFEDIRDLLEEEGDSTIGFVKSLNSRLMSKLATGGRRWPMRMSQH